MLCTVSRPSNYCYSIIFWIIDRHLMAFLWTAKFYKFSPANRIGQKQAVCNLWSWSRHWIFSPKKYTQWFTFPAQMATLCFLGNWVPSSFLPKRHLTFPTKNDRVPGTTAIHFDWLVYSGGSRIFRSGRGPVGGGRGPQTRLLFGQNACKNEGIGSRPMLDISINQ